ncbi:hypothetical protein [Legionella jordanis]|uniref:Oxidoreductase n=1 Tax=Legionella jordanis TaxID=456 RepID=A0A0W0VCA5_9GAMM|nr:hypothetical protein [Legionella jordanis]KTD17720.1 oxidoreductase [Legionella jordanis]RMX01585.1 hypothetical protein EAW55_10875 [Legionella jordanis]RMX21581.1 hypothetical protein EAS68_02155 [Legionella jordanis]VEH11346.1 oxidoreductase [Legionella jordanis]
MGKKTILRLAEGMDISPLMQRKLQTILGEFEIEFYPAIPNLRRSYQRRMQSFYNAFLLVLSSLPELKHSKEDLKLYVDWCLEFYRLPQEELPVEEYQGILPNWYLEFGPLRQELPIEQYQHFLSDYTSFLLSALKDHFPHYKSKEHFVELINKAEQYVIMKRGRADLATLIPIKTGNSVEYVLRWEEQLKPYTDKTFKEFEAIQQHAKENNGLNIPHWFRSLSPWMQIYLHSFIPSELISKDDLKTLTGLKRNLNSLTLQWSSIKLEQGANLHHDLENIAQGKIPLWMKSLNPEHQQLLKLMADAGLSEAGISDEIANFDNWLQDKSERLARDKKQLEHFNQLTVLELPGSLSFLNGFIGEWNKLKLEQGAALDHDLKQIAQMGHAKIPIWLKSLDPQHQLVLRILAETKLMTASMSLDVSTLHSWLLSEKERITSQNKSFEPLERLNSLRKLPSWVLFLEDFERHFLSNILQVGSLEQCISFAPSRLRRLPLLANFCETKVFWLNERGEVEHEYSTRMRSSHMAARDIVEWPMPIKRLYATRNLELIHQHASNQPLLIQTLISPVPWLHAYIPDYALDMQRKEIIASFQEEKDKLIVSTNHPFNIAKYLYYTTATDKSCQALITLVEMRILAMQYPHFIPSSWSLNKIKAVIALAFAEVEDKQALNSEQLFPEQDNETQTVISNLKRLFEKNHHALSQMDDWQAILAKQLEWKTVLEKEGKSKRFSIDVESVRELLKEYRTILNSPYGSATIFDYYGRELFLSSIENLLMGESQCKSYGSCVSGKDRREVLETHILAMLIFHKRKGYWPSMSHTGQDRADFVDIVADLWVTWHGYELAEQNADGSSGIKTPANYWPADIAAAICKKAGMHALHHSDVLATNNEVGRIGNLSVDKKNSKQVITVLKAAREDEGNAKEIITLLNHLIHHALGVKPLIMLLDLTRQGQKNPINRRSALEALHQLSKRADFMSVNNYLYAVLQLSREERAEILDLLTDLCNQGEFMRNKTSNLMIFKKEAPEGILATKDILQNRDGREETDMIKLTRIFAEICPKATEKWKRAPEILKIYQAIFNIQNHPQDKSAIKENIAELAKIKEIAIQYSTSQVIS